MGKAMVIALIVAGVLLAAFGVGQAARWQLLGLLDVADRWWPGDGGERRATALSYGPSTEQQVDVFVPAGTRDTDRKPVIIWFHGGGWDSGGRDFYGFAGRAFAGEGFVTVVAGYRLGSDGRYPAFIEDAAAAVKWTRANIAALGGDPDRIVLAGHSAGAHIALLSVLDVRWLGEEAMLGGPIKGVIALAAPTDFLPFERGGSADRAMGQVVPLSFTQPITFARGDAPPLWLATGDLDTTVRPRNSVRLGQAIRDAGGSADVVIYPLVDHIAIMTALSLPYRNRVPTLIEATAFAKRVTRRSDGALGQSEPLPQPAERGTVVAAEGETQRAPDRR